MPSETPEPTQEQRERADAVVEHRNKMYSGDWGSDGDEAALIAAALAADAAPLREEIGRLTKEVAQSDALLAGREQLRAAAEAKAAQYERDWMAAKYEFGNAMGKARENARSLEQQLSEERLKGEACTLDWTEKLDAALAAASRAREEQGALRAALVDLLNEIAPADFSEACLLCGDRGEANCCIDVAAARAALAPPAAESQENQQQLTGKGAQ